MDFFTQAGFIIGILVYGVVLSVFVSEKYHFLANIIASILSIIAGLSIGLNYEDLGISFNSLWPGILIAVAVSVVFAVVIFLISRIKFAREYFRSSHSALKSYRGRLVYETTIRIPLSTALTEEILFRGVLLGVLLSYNNDLLAVIISSVVFGLWHVLPSLNFANGSQHLRITNGSFFNKALHVSGNVIATGLAGLIFSWLRLISGSIIAPWLLHWTINSSALFSSFFVTKGSKK